MLKVGSDTSGHEASIERPCGAYRAQTNGTPSEFLKKVFYVSANFRSVGFRSNMTYFVTCKVRFLDEKASS